MYGKRFLCLLLKGIMLFLLVNRVYSQDLVLKELEAYQLNGSDELILDGRIDESFWSNVKPTNDFLMQVPVEGEVPSEKTEVRIAYDQANLYIGIHMSDANANQIKAYQKKRDASLGTDDRFLWIMDTFLDGRNAYYFAINPAGAMQDGLLTIGQGSSLDLNWDGIWRAWTFVNASGWSAEIRIPFRTLNFDPGKDRWGINFQRTIRRKNEELVWSGYKRSQGLLRPQNAGVLTGLSNISQGLGLEVVPYAAGRRNTAREEESLNTDYSGDLGLDINYNINPGLKASFTYNTDFAEAEVDTRQINLTRFPLLFPEKRDFFLEGSSIYSFAAASGVRPFFSRQIGLKDGRAIPINYGLRLLGNVGENDIALQHVRTGKLDEVQPEDFTVARIRRNIGSESRIGLIYTRRVTKNGDELPEMLQDRHTIGTDLELGTSKFMGDKNLQFQAFLVYHNPESPLNESSFWDRTSRGVRINFPNQPWSGHASYREFGTDYNPAVGFQSRVGFRRFQPSIGYNPLFEKSAVIRDIDFGLRFEHLMDMDWQLLTQEIRFTLFDLTFESADRIGLELSRKFEKLTEDFDILRDSSIIIPSGDYPTWDISLELATASYRTISGRIDLETGGFWSGTQTQIGLEVTGRPIPGLNMTGTYSHTDVSLDEGDFKTNLFRFNLSLDLTPFVSFATFLQWDDLRDQIGINNRFRWIIAPGNEIFLVYNRNWLDQQNRFMTQNSTAIVKATYTHRF